MPGDIHTGQSLRFRVRIDGGHDLGAWAKCDGLSVEYEVKEYPEGGENGYVHKIPGRAKYQNIKLTRAVNKDSAKVSAWLTSIQAVVKRQTAEIAAVDAKGQTIATWSLQGVYPAKWTGPSFDAGSSQIATETLELVHNGFLGG
ncbi:MAG TPA: phage tail protein [Candidatus Dormibacteraeota bacterium]|nr:phage tail protein [Candidatus Dormibacteraeota bacterium]